MSEDENKSGMVGLAYGILAGLATIVALTIVCAVAVGDRFFAI